MKSKVYFTKDISPESVVRLYDMVGKTLPGNVAIKFHSGEVGNQNFLRPEFWKPIVDHVGGTPVECNTAYASERNSTEKHWKTLELHGWTHYFNVDLMDADGPDMVLPIPDGRIIKVDLVGKNLANYNSTLVLSHFKGHPMGGYGGALKQLAIGFASSDGKQLIHGIGEVGYNKEQLRFLNAMADAAWAVKNYFGDNAVFINVMKNLSVDCDCCAAAEDPCMKDIGVLASLDPVAIDQACIDLVYASDDPGRDHFVERVESLNGTHTIEAAAELGVGSREYELIEV